MAELERQILRPPDSLEEWDAFVDLSPQGSIFCRSWWLDAVAPGRHEILVLRKNGKITAGMPMVHVRLRGGDVCHMPILTQTLGALLPPPKGRNYTDDISDETNLLRHLVAAVPRFSFFVMNFHYNFTNWLPFYWDGYEQTTRYTYVIDDLTDLEKVFGAFVYAKRMDIKKAERIVEVREDLAPEAFYENLRKTLRMRGQEIFYSYDHFERIHAACASRGAGKTWYAVDSAGNMHSGIFLVFDKKSAYYLISTIDPEHRSSGSHTLLLKHVIEFCAGRTGKFDFEGSMIEGVENSYRHFGAIRKPYFRISRDLRVLTRCSRFFRAKVAAVGDRLGFMRCG